jgi:hypothetical protein
VQKFAEELGIPTLLPGFDSASYKPAQMWTNGGIWHPHNPTPLPWDYCFGVVCQRGIAGECQLRGQEQIAVELP